MKREDNGATIRRVQLSDQRGHGIVWRNPKLTLIQLTTGGNVWLPCEPLLLTSRKVPTGFTTVNQNNRMSTGFECFRKCDVTKESSTIIGHICHE